MMNLQINQVNKNYNFLNWTFQLDKFTRSIFLKQDA